ncbi:hypothetical protein FACS1894205_2090 [Alphaproteobacteria bacterium]|nr:hypothetical protein FACS1894205_2090 [Alphaproteobacteria bacterium]
MTDMRTMTDTYKKRIEYLRWLLVLTINNARPYLLGEGPLLAVAQAQYPDATPLEIRRELDYLEKRKVAEISRDPSGPWRMMLTRYGIDIAEYTIDCEPGIARPVRYW